MSAHKKIIPVDFVRKERRTSGLSLPPNETWTDPGWNIWSILIFLLVLSVVDWLSSQYGSILFYSLVYNHGYPASETAQFALEHSFRFAVFVGLIGIMAVKRKISLYAAGFRPIPIKDWLTWGVGGGAALFFAISLIGYAVRWVNHGLKPQAVEDVLRTANGGGEMAVMLLIAVVLAPLWEELFFRGIVYSVIRSYGGPWWGIILSGLFFGAMHMDAVRFLPLAIGGMGLAYLYERSRNMYVPWIAHGIWNACMAFSVFWSV